LIEAGLAMRIWSFHAENRKARTILSAPVKSMAGLVSRQPGRKVGADRLA